MLRVYLNKLTKSPLIKELFSFSVSNVLFQGTRFVTYIFAAKILGPVKYGLWNGLVLLLMYCPYIHMGIFNALNREIPYYEGEGNYGKVKEVRDVGYGVAIVTAFPLMIGIYLASFFPQLHSDTVIGLRLMSLLVLVQHFYLFQQMILRSHGLFNVLSMQQLLFCFLSLILVLPATYILKFSGFILSQAVVIVICLAFIIYKIPMDLNPVFSYRKSKELSKIGFPIMMVGITFGLLQTTDRFMILSFLGKNQLGYYSLSIMAYSILTLLPLTVSQVFYPMMARRYGETKRINDLFKLVRKQVIVVLLIMLPVTITVFLISPILIKNFLPEYVKGVPALKNSLIGLCFLSLVGGFANFLNTIGYQSIYLAVVVIAVFLGASLDLLMIKLEYGIEGIAFATSMVNILYFIMICTVSAVIMKNNSVKQE